MGKEQPMRTRRPYYLFKVITRERGAIWPVCHYERIGVQREQTTGELTKAKARKFAVDLLQKNATARSMTLKEFTKDFFVWGECTWIKRQFAQGRGYDRQWAATKRSMLLNHLIPKFGTLRLEQIIRPAVERWLVGLVSSKQTRNHFPYSLRTVIAEAETEAHFERNPLEHADPLGKQYRRRDIFTLEELKLLIPEGELKPIAEFVRVLGT
jgi:hypothetical protein